MSICASLFEKEIEELTVDDIERYFEFPREESDVIEYKSYFINNQNNHKHKENAVLKTICAFLNSSGGLLIWGAPVENRNDESGGNIYAGELSPVTIDIARDNFMSKIVNRILPIPKDIQYHKINAGEDGFIYVFEVKQSLYKPHQFDSRFWMRSNGQTNVAPYHYVEALFKQIRYPNLHGIISFGKVKYPSANSGRTTYKLPYTISIKNQSPYQNETNPKLTIYIDGTVVKKVTDSKVLHYGDPIVVSRSAESFHRGDSKFTFMITFGGDKSPLKVSKYIVKCTNVSILKTSGKSAYSEPGINTEIQKIFENKFIFELDD